MSVYRAVCYTLTSNIRVHLAFSHYIVRGYSRINPCIDGPIDPIYLSIDSLESDPKTETILTWGYRLLYLEISLFLITSMFYWEHPMTLPFAGAILAFFYVAQIWKGFTGAVGSENQ